MVRHLKPLGQGVHEPMSGVVLVHWRWGVFERGELARCGVAQVCSTRARSPVSWPSARLVESLALGEDVGRVDGFLQQARRQPGIKERLDIACHRADVPQRQGDALHDLEGNRDVLGCIHQGLVEVCVY